MIGKRKELIGSLLFKFIIEHGDICTPTIHLSAVQNANNSMSVTIEGECFNLHGNEDTVQFQCSVAGREFVLCEFCPQLASNKR